MSAADRGTGKAVAVVGGGFLGSALATALDARGIATRVFSRSGDWRGDAPAPRHVECRPLDITHAPLDPGAFAGCGPVVLAVAPGGSQDRRALYVGGTAAVLGCGHAFERVVYIGSTSAVGSLDGWVDEDSAPSPTTERGMVQRDAEAEAQRRGARSGTPTLALRLGGLYGPGRALGRVYRRRTEDAMLGHGHVPTNLIHRDDAVQATLAALANPEVEGVIHVCDDDHRTRRAMYAAVAELGGQPPPRWSAETPPGPPQGKRIANQRMKSALGVRLLHPEHQLDANAPGPLREPAT